MTGQASIERRSVQDFTEQAYLDYSMYVILDRALPFVGDGLKPVQRRLVYAMSQLGLSAQAKYKKSARTIGDVLGKFHPHGDQACYEAMVLMAQPFSYRYPLIDGQGNWGSTDDPKSFAAMRYTEARLTAYAAALLQELPQGTVEWQPNFDGTLQEPKYLPARLPNVLLNGSTGIAVGMATDIVPHNLNEVVQACVHLLDHPKATVEDISALIPGPDFPTPALIITPPEDLQQLYRTGVGSVRMRADYRADHKEVIVHALPHQVSGAKVLAQIAQQMRSKQLPQIVDLRDESDHEHPVRLVLVLKSRQVDVSALMLHLFASTDLEKQYRVNFNVIDLDGHPRTLGLVPLLKTWLQFRQHVVVKRLQHRLDQIKTRLHLLEGFKVAFDHLEEVIAIIRHEDDPQAVLMQRFDLSEAQSEAILNMRLKQLAKLEQDKIEQEITALTQEQHQLERYLASDTQLKKLIKQELLLDAKSFGQPRCSPIRVVQPAQTIRVVAPVSQEPVTVVLSQKGWIRVAKGHEMDLEKLNYRTGDGLLTWVSTTMNRTLTLFDDTGRVYQLPVQELPSARGHGEPLTSRLTPPAGSRFIQALVLDDSDVVWASDAGYGLVVAASTLMVRPKSGKQVLTTPTGYRALAPVPCRPDASEVVLLAEGRLLCCPLDALPRANKGKGQRLIRLNAPSERLRALAVLTGADRLVVPGQQALTLDDAARRTYRSDRGLRGHLLPKSHRAATQLVVL